MKALDKRLAGRLAFMHQVAMTQPKESFPTMFPVRKDLDGSYDLFANKNVTPDQILAKHVAETVTRCEQLDEVLIISDITDFTLGGEKRQNLGKTNHGGQGFFGHVSLAVSMDGDVLGVLGLECWVRTGPSRTKQKKTRGEIQNSPDNENLVWERGGAAAGSALRRDLRSIHVRDAGADGYRLWDTIEKGETLAVVRAAHDRKTHRGGELVLMSTVLESAKTLLKREVFLSARKKGPFPTPRRLLQPRASRTATLEVSASEVTIVRPKRAPSSLLPEIQLNAVRVLEKDPPQGMEPVEWILLTNLPIASAADAERVVDIYRKRWLIEEFFKALKTGCAVERRQLETAHSLMNMTAFFMPIAAKMLHLRNLARSTPQAPASLVCSNDELHVLTRISIEKLPPQPTAKDVLYAVARLGGFLKSNGNPGWMVLGRGWLKLTEFMQLLTRFQATKQSKDLPEH